MKVYLSLMAIALLGGCNSTSDADNGHSSGNGSSAEAQPKDVPASNSHPEMSLRDFNLSNDMDSYNRTVELAKDALGTLGGSSGGVRQANVRASDEERTFTARALASTLPPVGSGNGAERVTRQEVELDPPAEADWIARSRIVYAGARSIDVYLFDAPVVAANSNPDDAATMLEVKADKLVDTPVGVVARTGSKGEGPAFWCMALPISISRDGVCAMTANGTKRLLMTTYARRSDNEPVVNPEAVSRLFATLRVMYAKR
ncbi:hypothetical protein [Sphingobium cloacae]|uniref:Lipoprotein n=1 Tax=Sphingobium cloacae TaxID=120107 RepID=A0A1E1F489_9SPHN|nr:hypothetical protein [Sphingobium cloacae]BAV65340.1 hypothetical protein SCLO_1023000 [Sphingobium cloacae]